MEDTKMIKLSTENIDSEERFRYKSNIKKEPQFHQGNDNSRNCLDYLFKDVIKTETFMEEKDKNEEGLLDILPVKMQDPFQDNNSVSSLMKEHNSTSRLPNNCFPSKQNELSSSITTEVELSKKITDKKSIDSMVKASEPSSNGLLINSDSEMLQETLSDPFDKHCSRFYDELPFLRKTLMQDINYRKQSDPSYNINTLYVPAKFLESLSDVLKQWWDIKATHLRSIIFYENNDSFVSFYMDALVLNSELNCSIVKNSSSITQCIIDSALLPAYEFILHTRGYTTLRVIENIAHKDTNSIKKKKPIQFLLEDNDSLKDVKETQLLCKKVHVSCFSKERPGKRPKRPCFYCGEFQSHLSVHLKRHHKQEKLVIKAMHAKTLKRNIEYFQFIRNLGINKYNQECFKKNKEIISCRQQSLKEKVQCLECLKLISKSCVGKHRKACIALSKEDGIAVAKISVNVLKEQSKDL